MKLQESQAVVQLLSAVLLAFGWGADSGVEDLYFYCC